MINKDFNSILDLINTFLDEEACILHLEELRWNGHVVSPFEPTSKVYKCANHRYRCKVTGKYFNVKTATLFDNTKVKLQKWFIAIWLVTSHKKSISSLQISRDLNVTQKTAWFMLQRIRACFDVENNDNNNDMLDNTVEIDETYVGGKVKACIVDTVQSKTLTADLCTDEWFGYKGVLRIYSHAVVKHNEGEYIRGQVHTNTIEGFWSLWKRRIIEIYHFTSKKHLQKYVDEFLFRYNTRQNTEAGRFNLLLVNLELRTRD